MKNLRYEILDVNGIKLLTGKINDSETVIFVGDLRPSVYFMNLSD